MFTFGKKGAKSLAKNSDLISNEILKKAIVSATDNKVGGQNIIGIGYTEVIYDRIIHERVIKD